MKLPSLLEENPSSIFGMPVYLSANLDKMPKMQLSDKLCKILDQQFAKEMNEWLLDFFGMESQIIIVTDPNNGQKVMYAGYLAWEEIKKKVLVSKS